MIFIPSLVPISLKNCLRGYSDLLFSGYTGVTNTPGNDSFVLVFPYSLKNETRDRYLTIAFLPNMSIDFSRTSEHDHDYANNILLAPTINYVRLLTGNPEFDIWKLFSWLFVSYYWTFLNDLGQTSPTTYIPLRD